MPCGCQGGGPPPIPVTSGDLTNASSNGGVPGMPRYKVTGGTADPSKTFDTYGAARDYKQQTGGKIRPI